MFDLIRIIFPVAGRVQVFQPTSLLFNLSLVLSNSILDTFYTSKIMPMLLVGVYA